MSDTSTKTTTTTQFKVPSRWRVTLLNDDYTPMDFVIQVLIHLFNKTGEEATELAMRVHLQGSASVGLYTKEIARTKVTQVRATAERHQHPLEARADEA